jgi:hypothetical protein
MSPKQLLDFVRDTLRMQDPLVLVATSDRLPEHMKQVSPDLGMRGRDRKGDREREKVIIEDVEGRVVEHGEERQHESVSSELMGTFHAEFLLVDPR